MSGHAVALRAVRALKMHGGGPPVTAGKPLDKVYREENVELVSKGCCNLARHIANARAYGVPVVVAINKFASDSDAELEAVRRESMQAGAQCGPFLPGTAKERCFVFAVCCTLACMPACVSSVVHHLAHGACGMGAPT